MITANCSRKTDAAETFFTPETSANFRKYVEPVSGVVSYILDTAFPGCNHQSLYFTQKSMSNDGRFLVFNISGGRLCNRKHLAVYDFKSDKAYRISCSSRIPYLDVETAQLYYVTESGVIRHDLGSSPSKAELITAFPREIADLKNIQWYCTHPTFTRDKKKIFFDISTNDARYIQGLLDLETGEFDKWGETDFYLNHGQMHPFRNELALCAWEGLNGRLVDGVYPRLWLLEPDGKRTMIPPSLTNYATHEHWSCDGKGFYYCSGGVYYHELESGKQHLLVPMNAAHAVVSADNSFSAFDCPVGKWYRGCSWQVGFFNIKTGRGFYFYPELAAYNTIDNQSKLHPDPHPQFVCGDKYIISTVNSGSGLMSLSVTPVRQLIELTSK